MNDRESSKRLLELFRHGDSRAATQVFDRYVDRLMRLVRRRMSPGLQRRVDPDDVVQSAMRSFFVRAAAQDYVLERAGDLWRLLAAITLSKLRRQVEVHTAAKRSMARERSISGDANDIAAIADREPSPGEETVLLEEVQRVMEQCSLAEREALTQRLSGETIEDIAQRMGRSQRTVRRLLQASRETLERRLLTEEDADRHE
ncbi:MAG: ECF-type sigma factor [Pirellulaceae bacterium]